MKTLIERTFAALALMASLPVGTALAQADIGAASSVYNSVTGERPGNNRKLALGDRVYQNEVIATAADARGQILFRDETALTLGPDSRVTLDRFVYNPGGQSSATLNATKGVFRFVSGNMPSSSYNLQTPAGTIGVRGTIVDWISDSQKLVAQLIKGQFEFRNSSGRSVLVSNVGDVLEVEPDGSYTISTKLTNLQRSQLAAIRDLFERNDNLDRIGRERVREVLRKPQSPSSGNVGRPGGGGPGGPGDGG